MLFIFVGFWPGGKLKGDRPFADVVCLYSSYNLIQVLGELFICYNVFSGFILVIFPGFLRIMIF